MSPRVDRLPHFRPPSPAGLSQVKVGSPINLISAGCSRSNAEISSTCPLSVLSFRGAWWGWVHPVIHHVATLSKVNATRHFWYSQCARRRSTGAMAGMACGVRGPLGPGSPSINCRPVEDAVARRPTPGSSPRGRRRRGEARRNSLKSRL